MSTTPRLKGTAVAAAPPGPRLSFAGAHAARTPLKISLTAPQQGGSVLFAGLPPCNPLPIRAKSLTTPQQGGSVSLAGLPPCNPLQSRGAQGYSVLRRASLRSCPLARCAPGRVPAAALGGCPRATRPPLRWSAARLRIKDRLLSVK